MDDGRLAAVQKRKPSRIPLERRKDQRLRQPSAVRLPVMRDSLLRTVYRITQRSSGHPVEKTHYEKCILPIYEKIHERNKARVLQLLHDLCFRIEALCVGRIQKTLHRHRLTRLQPLRLEDLSEAALADEFQPAVRAVSILEIVEPHGFKPRPEFRKAGIPLLTLRSESLAQYVFNPSQDTTRKRLEENRCFAAAGMARPSRHVPKLALTVV